MGNRSIDARPGIPLSTRDLGMQAKPVGPLAEMLQNYGAPDDVQRTIARRAGNLVGTGILPLGRVEQNILRTMELGNGMPQWGTIVELTAAQVRDRYQRMRRGAEIRK